jgi:hypothetical protein
MQDEPFLVEGRSEAGSLGSHGEDTAVKNYSNTAESHDGHCRRKSRRKRPEATTLPSSTAPPFSRDEAETTRVLLLNNGFDVDTFWKPTSSVLKAVRNALSRQDDNSPQVRALNWAAKNGYVTAVRVLLEKGVILRSQRSQKLPALLQATLNRHIEIARLLFITVLQQTQ